MALCLIALFSLGLGIYAYSMYLAGQSGCVYALIFTAVLPMLGAPFWALYVWIKTGQIFNWMTIGLLAWTGILVFGVWLAVLVAPDITEEDEGF